jgi:hypothetical protein
LERVLLNLVSTAWFMSAISCEVGLSQTDHVSQGILFTSALSENQ